MSDKFFEILHIRYRRRKVVITLFVSPKCQKTSQRSDFAESLISALPNLKYHRCDNEKHYSFCDELKDTELAHAFEHALLDIIGDKDENVRKINGVTVWNWKLKPRNTYEIHIDYINKDIVGPAVSETAELFESLLPV